MDEMSASYEQSKEVIRRYDEIISEKASKTSIKELYEFVRRFIESKKVQEIEAGIQKQFDVINEQLASQTETLKFVSENIEKNIHTAVRRATAALKNQLQASNQGAFGGGQPGQTGYGNSGSGVGMDSGELRKILLTKVEKSELEAVIDMKSNKADTDMALKGLDIIHKQITHMIVLVIEMIKLSMTQMSLATDSDKTRHHKALMYTLQQAVNVCRWINDFDPQNVNIVDLVLPQELKTLNDHSKSLVREFPKIDQVAELALRKFRARGGAGGGASG